MKEEKELIKALKYALDFEIKGERIYREIAAESEDGFVKNIFNSLADDEAIHKKVIKEYIKGKADFSLLKKITADPKRLFGMVSSAFKKRAALAARRLEPFDIGVELEKKSIDYYSKHSKKAKTETTKRFFDFLTDQEKFHLKSLQEAKNFLSDPKNFYVEFERWTLEG